MQNLAKSREFAQAFHALLARNKWLTAWYFSCVSVLCRNLLPRAASVRIENLLTRTGIVWPTNSFRARRVVLGGRTEVLIIPYLGEFCQSALFSRRMSYEQPVFCWLETEVNARYDLVVEVGANVGVYTIFLDALMKSEPYGRLKRVVCFEPALEPFSRLIENLRANSSVNVLPFRAALGKEGGFHPFYEPAAHLTNGSFVKTFAEAFAPVPGVSLVAVHCPDDLEPFLQDVPSILLKVDVEGYEPELLTALSNIIDRHRPDILIEVLVGTPEHLNILPCLGSYSAYLITPHGLIREPLLRADPEHRDWLLRAERSDT